MIAAAVLAALTACNKTLIEGPMTDSEYGYIDLGITADTEMIQTKAEITGDALNAYRIALYDLSASPKTAVWGAQNGATDGFITYATAMSEQSKDLWKVVGGKSYEVYVENMDDDGLYPDASVGFPHIYGNKSVTVSPGISTTCEVDCKPQNSKVTFACANDITTSFEIVNLVLDESGRNITLTSLTGNHDNAQSVYFPASKSVTWKFKVKPKGETTEKYYTSSVTTAAQTWTKVTFTTGETKGQIKVQISVTDSFNQTVTSDFKLDPFSSTVTPQN